VPPDVVYLSESLIIINHFAGVRFQQHVQLYHFRKFIQMGQKIHSLTKIIHNRTGPNMDENVIVTAKNTKK
jgi:hypothetical protein